MLRNICLTFGLVSVVSSLGAKGRYVRPSSTKHDENGIVSLKLITIERSIKDDS